MADSDEYAPSDGRKWSSDFRTLSVRSKSIEAECAKIRSVVLPDANAPSRRSRSHSHTSRSLPSHTIGPAALDDGTNQQLRRHYSTKLRLLRSHIATAMSALQSIRSGHAPTIAAGKDKCRGAVELYESHFAEVVEGASEERLELEREAAVLEGVIGGVMGRMERWETRSANAAAEDDYPADGSSKKASGLRTARSHGIPRDAETPIRNGDGDCVDDGADTIRRAVTKLETAISADGGNAGGWEEEEHRSFVRMWSNNNKSGRNMEALLERYRGEPALLGRSDDEIEDHAVWYRCYLDRVERKRALIARWKECRKQERCAKEEAGGDGEYVVVESDKENLTPNAKNNIEESAEAKKKKLEKERRERTKTKEAVTKWREDRQRQQWKVGKELRDREEEERRIEKAKKKAVNDRLKKRLVDWKTFEEERRAQRNTAAEMPAQPRLSRADLERRRQSDIDRAKALSQTKELRRNPGQARRDRIAKLASAVSPNAYGVDARVKRDPGRLIRATRSSSRRALTAEELDDKNEVAKVAGAHEGRVALAARDLTTGMGLRRAIPTWRRGL